MLAGPRVLVTGATGRFGRRMAVELARAGCELVLVVRAGSQEAALERARGALSPHVNPGQLSVVCGDVTEPWLGLEARDRKRLWESLDVIVHAAATTRFTLPLEMARITNVLATRNVLAFAERVPRLWRFGHLSTAFVAGRRKGRVFETDLEHEQGFLNSYQRSKYEAELFLRRYRDRLPLVVFRPSVVLDGPETSSRRSAFRFAFELVRRGLVPAVPGGADTPVDLVTENDAARGIAQLLFLPGANGVYHVASGDRATPLGDIVDGFGVRFLGLEQFATELSTWRTVRPQLAPVYDELSSFIFELAYPKIFDTTRIEAALGHPVPTEDPLASLVAARRERRRTAHAGVATR